MIDLPSVPSLRRGVFRLWVAATLSAFAVPAIADELDINGVRITVPNGWETVRENGTLQLQREFPETEDAGSGRAMIHVIGPYAEAEASFAENFSTMMTSYKPLADEDPFIEAEGENTNGHVVRMERRCCSHVDGISIDISGIGVAGDGQQFFLLMATAELEDENADTADADFAAMARSIRLPGDESAFAIAPRPGDGGLDGVYSRLETGFTLNAFGGMDYYADVELRVFDPSGLVSDELPDAGRSVTQHCKVEPLTCGYYALNEAAAATEIELVTVANDYGILETDRYTFARDGADFEIDGMLNSRLEPFEPDTRLDGAWSFTWASSGSTAFSSGSVSVVRTLVFYPDGRFERTGWSGATTTSNMGGSDVGTTTSSDQPMTSGTYRIEGYSLVLTGADGQTETLSIVAPDEGSYDLLVINGSNYLLEDS